jgi:fatty-acyl-CoA synthase
MYGIVDKAPLLGLIQERPLLVSDALIHASIYHADTPVISRRRDGSFFYGSWAGLERRVRRLASALLAAGVERGDRVATLAWNNHRHLEAYFAITAIGAVCHPINPRLFPEQVAYIAKHAEDVGLFYDLEYEQLARVVAEQNALRFNIALCTTDELRSDLPDDVVAYESFIDSGHEEPSAYLTFDEHTAASLCYTSGTTGNPKGVLTNHRALMLHAMTARTSDVFDLRPTSIACAIVPLYHVHASWGLPFAAAMAGAGLVLPGLRLDAVSLAETINLHRVTFANGVPTIWNDLVRHLSSAEQTAATLKRIVVAGSAPSPTLVQALEDRGVEVCHIWGMTETGPCATSAAMLPRFASNPMEKKVKQGHGLFGVQMRISNEHHAHCPWGEEHVGALQVRGPYVISGYFKQEGKGAVDADGWLDTGDIASIDADGYLKIVDREKDLVKSGGEWISSIEIENIAGACPGVKEAAVIAVPHERWGERPVLLVVRAENFDLDLEHLMAFLSERVSTWWLPDRVIFIPELPKTGTGKVMKAELRKRFVESVATAET